MLSVLFTHPDQCFMTEERLNKARYLNLKYAKCFVAEREGTPIAVVALYTQAGTRLCWAEADYVAGPDALLRLTEAYLDGVYDGYLEQVPQRLLN